MLAQALHLSCQVLHIHAGSTNIWSPPAPWQTICEGQPSASIDISEDVLGANRPEECEKTTCLRAHLRFTSWEANAMACMKGQRESQILVFSKPETTQEELHFSGAQQ
jgi:hypothetical protein